MLIRRLFTLAVLPFVLPVAAWAQGAPAGVVTRLEGNVTAARASLPQPVALKFKDGVFVNDRIVTGDQSIVRMLLGGKAVVTVRERSSLTITEVPGRSTMNLESGKIALAVARERMRAGDSIEIRTPNAVAGIRGTVVIAEYKETTAQLGGRGGLTTFFGLRGTFEAIFGTQSFVVGAGQFAAGGAAGAKTGTMTAEMLAAALSGLQVPTAEVADGGQDSAKDQALGTTVATFGQQLASVQSNVGSRLQNLIDTNRPAPNPPQLVWLPGGGQSNLAAEVSTILSTTLGPSRSPVTPPVPGHTITPNSIDRSAGPFNSPSFGLLVANGLVTDQYKSLGVVFGLPSVRVGIVDLDGVPAWAGVNSSNTVDLLSPVQGHFVVPGTFTPATTNAVSVEIVSASVGSLLLEVFDQSGGPVDFSHNGDGTGPQGRTLAKVSAPGIASFIVSIMPGNRDPWGMDQLSWGDIVDPPAVLTLGGPLFRATNEQRSAFTTFLNIFDETIVGQSPDPLVWLEASRITTAHNFARLTNADVTAAGAFLRLESGSEIVQTGSTDPLVLMMGGSLRVGSDAAPGTLFELMGRTGFTLADPDPDPVTGAPTGLVLGTDRPLQPAAGAPVFQADAGAVVAVRGSLYKADTALLEATAPLLLVTGNSTVTTGSHAVDLTNRAKVAIPNDAVAMLNVDRGVLNVLNGHLVNVVGGSRLNLAGDLLRIGSGATVNIFNGALLNVSGASVASIDGALVRFTGSGGVLNVTNTLAPTTFLGGVPVYVASGATANLSLGTGALAGLNLGTIRINNAVLPANAGPGSVTGSLITVQGAGGSVRAGRN